MRTAHTPPTTTTLHRDKPFKVAVVIPICNAYPFASAQIAALRSQTVAPERVIVIDSESTDGSPELFAKAGFELVRIPRRTFDHGGTRNLGMSLAPDADILVYMTQDAIPHGVRTIQTLLETFADPAIGIAYGRQLARQEASAIERHARLFNYPPLSARHSLLSIPSLGIKCIFNSNACAAYRRTALATVGGFPEPVIMGEDQVAAAKVILAGWSVAYAADANVTHSHGYSLAEEFRRYFDIGVFHNDYHLLLKNFASTTSEGIRFVLSEMIYLLRRAPWQIPEACARTTLKLLGYRLGRNEGRLPRRIKLRLAMQKTFFLERPGGLRTDSRNGLQTTETK